MTKCGYVFVVNLLAYTWENYIETPCKGGA